MCTPRLADGTLVAIDMSVVPNLLGNVLRERGLYMRSNWIVQRFLYLADACLVTALVIVLSVGCGVDSGVRDENTPGYTGGPGAGLPGGGSNPGSNPGDAAAEEQKVFELVNEEREKEGRSPLEWCDGLHELAKAHSNDMCDRGFFSHVNP
jgi:hypothetical protein